MRSLFQKLHLWISFPFGLVIAIICFTGSLLVFEQELYELGHRDMVFVQPEGEPLPLAQLVPLVVAGVPEGVEVTGVTISEEPNRAYKIHLSEPRHAAIFVNQYTGEQLGQFGRTPFYRVVFFTHRWLMDSARVGGDGISLGKTIVGVSTILFVLALITGVVLWAPRRWRSVWKSLKIRKGKAFWYSLHSAGGMYGIVLLLALALTGLTWSFEWYNKGFYKLFGGEVTQGARPKRLETEADYLVYDRVLAELSGLEYKEIRITPGNARLTLGGWGNQSAVDEYYFDGLNGMITQYTPYKDQERNSKIRGWVRSIHFGMWGGYFSKIITFLVGLLGASLPLTGYYLWWKKIRAKRIRSHFIANNGVK